jgi:hypothetical protein
MDNFIRNSNDMYLVGFNCITGETEWGSKSIARIYEHTNMNALNNATDRSGMDCVFEPVVPKTKHEKWAELIASMYEIYPEYFDMCCFSTCVVGHMARKGWIKWHDYNQVCEYLEIDKSHISDMFSSKNAGNTVQDMIKKYQLYVANGFKLR